MIGIDVIGPTSLGTSTTKTQLGGADMILPSWARSILAIITSVTLDTPTAAEGLTSTTILESDDFNVQPFEVPNQPLDSILGTNTAAPVSKNEKYPVNCLVKGGDRLKVYGQAKVANTAAPYHMVGVVVSDQVMGTQKHAKTGTATSTGTTASSEVSGTPYSFSGGKRITELLGNVVHTTLAASSAIIGYMRFASSEFQQSSPAKLPLMPSVGLLGALGTAQVAEVSRAPVDIPLIAGPTTISDFLYMGLAPAAAGYFQSGVIYE